MSPLKLQRGVYLLQKLIKHHAWVALLTLLLSSISATSCKPNFQTLSADHYEASNDYLFALSTAAALKPVIVRPGGGAGVLDRVGGAERLWAI